MEKTSKTNRSIGALSILVILMVLALNSVYAEASIEQVSKSYFDNQEKILINFEDASLQPGLQYWETNGVRFIGTDATTTIRIGPSNRNNVLTASGQYSLFSDAIFPSTSANIPLNIIFKNGVSAVGFYAGNGENNVEQVKATISVYGKENKFLGSFVRNDITDAVTSFIGIKSNNDLIYKVSLDYGDSFLGEELDNVMFIKSPLFDPINTPYLGASTFILSVNDYPDHKDYSKSKNIPHAYVNMYTVMLNDNKFKITNFETKQTGNSENPHTIFTIQHNQMVYFEGFKTKEGAQNGATKKMSLLWNTPPYKNFGTTPTQLCQTHFTEVNEFLQYDEKSACALSLSTPYQDEITSSNRENTKNTWIWKKAIFKNKQAITNGYQYDVVPTDMLPATNSECIKDFDSSICLEKVHLFVDENGKHDYITLMLDISGIKGIQILGFETKNNQNHFLSYLNTPKVTIAFNPATLKLSVTKKEIPLRQYNLLLTVKNDIKGAYLDWNDLSEFGDTFDKYNIRFKKGTDLREPIVNSYISYGSYYNLVELRPGDKWTFQVCPTKNKEIVGSCSNFVTVLIKDGMFDFNKFNNGKDNKIERVSKLNIPAITIPLPAIVSSTIEPLDTNPITCTNGCNYNNKCLPVGTRIEDFKDSDYYCSLNNELEEQQAIGTICQNNYECGTNSCVSSQCMDLKKTLEEQQTLMEKILSWFKRVFG